MIRAVLCALVMCAVFVALCAWVGGGWDAKIATVTGRELVVFWGVLGLMGGAVLGGIWKEYEIA